MDARLKDFTDDELLEGFAYLDELRDSGQTNMFGAARYIATDLGHPLNDARALLSLWMDTFDPEKSPEERVAEALS